MSTPLKRLTAALVVLSVALGIGVYSKVAYETKPGIKSITATGDWGQALRTCYALGGTAFDGPAGACVSDVIWEAAQQDKMMEASEAVTLFAKEDYGFYGLCHGVVHLLGESLYKYYGSIEESIQAVNSRDCGTGLAHGVIDYWTLSSPSLDEFVSAAAACEMAMASMFGGCAEGIGHAAYQHQEPGTPRRLEMAFERCSIFKVEENQEFCAYGVMMQPYIKQNTLITEKAIPVPAWDEHLSVCNRLDVPVGVQRGCFSGGGWVMGMDVGMRVAPFDLINLNDDQIAVIATESDRGVGICNSDVVVEQHRMRCTQEFLARLPTGWYRSIPQLETRCEIIAGRHGTLAGELCLSGAKEFTPPSVMAGLISRHPLIERHLKFDSSKPRAS
jgi:hypothetical protein